MTKPRRIRLLAPGPSRFGLATRRVMVSNCESNSYFRTRKDTQIASPFRKTPCGPPVSRAIQRGLHCRASKPAPLLKLTPNLCLADRPITEVFLATSRHTEHCNQPTRCLLPVYNKVEYPRNQTRIGGLRNELFRKPLTCTK